MNNESDFLKNSPIFELTSSSGMVLKVYEDHLILTQKGFMGALTRGFAGEKKIYYRDLTSIQFKSAGWTPGFIEFTFPGSNDKSGGAISGVTNENRYTFSNSSLSVQKQLTKEALKAKDFIDEKIKTYKKLSRSTAFSIADEVLKLKELLDKDIITEDEFKKMKLELLN